MARILLLVTFYFITININMSSSDHEGSPREVKEYVPYEERGVGRGIDGGISCAACSVLLVTSSQHLATSQ